MPAKKVVTTTVKYTVEIDEDRLIALYLNWHAMHALRCEVGHHQSDAGLSSGTVYLSPGYMAERANVENFFDDLSDEDFDRIRAKINRSTDGGVIGVHEFVELSKRQCRVSLGK